MGSVMKRETSRVRAGVQRGVEGERDVMRKHLGCPHEERARYRQARRVWAQPS